MRPAFAFWWRHRVEGIWLVLVIAVATAVAGTLIPSWKASKTDPVTALRVE